MDLIACDEAAENWLWTQILSKHYQAHPLANQATSVNSDDQIILTAEEAARQIQKNPYSQVILLTEDLGMAAKHSDGVKVITLMNVPSTRQELARLLLPQDLLNASKAWEQHRGEPFVK